MISSLILASASPRRKKLLEGMGIAFEVVISDVEEVLSGIYPPDIPLVNAIAKAKSVAGDFPDALVIGADTVVEFEGQTLGKPQNSSDAVAMLELMSGKEHLVVTAVCLCCISKEIECVFCEESIVKFKRLNRSEITNYINVVDVLDKAGAYAAQEHRDMIIESIDGPLDNVIGLPCARLKEAIQACDFGSLLKPTT